VTATMTLDWHYKQHGFPYTSDHGTADVKLGGTTIALNLQVGTANGRPTAVVVAHAVAIGSLDLTLHGGASWLYNIFISVFSGQIKSAVKDTLDKEIVSETDSGLAKVLASIPITQDIGKDVYIDYRLVATPEFAANFFTLDLKGEFFDLHAAVEAPFVAVATPNIVTTVDMANVFITEYLAKTAGYAFFQVGALKYNVTEKEVPANSPIQLNTSSFQDLIPGLYQKYPNKLLQLDLYSTKPPLVSFSKTGIFVQVPGNIDVLVVNGTNDLPLAFTLSGYFDMAGFAAVEGSKITGSLKLLNITFSLSRTNVGTFDASVLQNLINFMLEQGVIPAANKILANGIIIPIVDGISLVKSAVVYADQYIYVTADLAYKQS